MSPTVGWVRPTRVHLARGVDVSRGLGGRAPEAQIGCELVGRVEARAGVRVFYDEPAAEDLSDDPGFP